MSEDRWSWSTEEEEDYNSLNHGKHRIPSSHDPLALGYIQPLQQYLDKWKMTLLSIKTLYTPAHLTMK